MVIALDLRGFAVSTGSACSSGAMTPSHVLTAIGLSADSARSSIRFSLACLIPQSKWTNSSRRSKPR